MLGYESVEDVIASLVQLMSRVSRERLKEFPQHIVYWMLRAFCHCVERARKTRVFRLNEVHGKTMQAEN